MSELHSIFQHTYLESNTQTRFGPGMGQASPGHMTIDIERKNRLLMVCYVPATSATFLAFFSFILAAAINSTNEANKAGGMCHKADYIT